VDFHLTLFNLRILERQKQKYYLNSTQTYLSMMSYEMWFCYRGSILACALPWLRSLLLQHSTGIMSQESSLLALNSLYQVKNENLTLERLWRVMYSNEKVFFILKFMSEYALWTFLLSFWPFPGYQVCLLEYSWDNQIILFFLKNLIAEIRLVFADVVLSFIYWGYNC